MPSEHLSVDEFFTKLMVLFEENSKRSHGSIFLSQKRMTYGGDSEIFTGKKGQTDTLADLSPPKPLPVLIRATNGDSKDKLKSKIKLSTLVESDDIEAFYIRYAEVCRAGMSALKKRDRSGRKKKAKKRKVTTAEGEKKG